MEPYFKIGEPESFFHVEWLKGAWLPYVKVGLASFNGRDHLLKFNYPDPVRLETIEDLKMVNHSTLDFRVWLPSVSRDGVSGIYSSDLLATKTNTDFLQSFFPDGMDVIAMTGVRTHGHLRFDFGVRPAWGEDFQLFEARNLETAKLVFNRTFRCGFVPNLAMLPPGCTRAMGDIREQDFFSTLDRAVDQLSSGRFIYLREGDWMMDVVLCTQDTLPELQAHCEDLLRDIE